MYYSNTVPNTECLFCIRVIKQIRSVIYLLKGREVIKIKLIDSNCFGRDNNRITLRLSLQYVFCIMDKELTKLYYTIGEVADLFEVSPSLLRYWQTEFPRLKPKTNKKGDRKYTKKEILYIEKIYDLVKLKGYTLDGARKALSSNRIPEQPVKEVLLKKLRKIKEELRAMEDKLD